MKSPKPDRIHVHPLFGRKHKMRPNCWCEPQPDRDYPTIFIHNAEH